MLKVNQSIVNLGVIKFGVEHTFTYILTNTFEKDVHIMVYTPGCKACTEVELEKQDLKPGESTNLLTKFTPGSLGVANKTVVIVYNVDGEVQPELVLKFKGAVVE